MAATETDQPAAPRRWIRRLIVGVIVVAVLAVGIPLAYIHFFDSSPASLTLTAAPGQSGPSVPLDGTWGVGPGSEVQYRVGERLGVVPNTAVGSTTAVTGSMTIEGTTVRSGSFVVDLTTVKSDQSSRDHQFQSRIMDTSKYPTASFKFTKHLDFGTPPADGSVKTVIASGDLTLHGTTAAVTFPVQVRHTGTAIETLATIPITFATWNIPNPSLAGFVTTEDHGVLLARLDFVKGSSPAVPTTGASDSDDSGGSADSQYRACLAQYGVTLPAPGSGGGGPGGGSAGSGTGASGSGGGYGPPPGASGSTPGSQNPATAAAMAACAQYRPAAPPPPTVSPTTAPPLGF